MKYKNSRKKLYKMWQFGNRSAWDIIEIYLLALADKPSSLHHESGIYPKGKPKECDHKNTLGIGETECTVCGKSFLKTETKECQQCLYPDQKGVHTCGIDKSKEECKCCRGVGRIKKAMSNYWTDCFMCGATGKNLDTLPFNPKPKIERINLQQIFLIDVSTDEKVRTSFIEVESKINEIIDRVNSLSAEGKKVKYLDNK
jgi:hypothetical protein